MSEAESLLAQKDAQIQILNEKVSKLEGLHASAIESAHSLKDKLTELQLDLASSASVAELRSIIERAWLTDWRKTENDLIAAGLGRLVSEIKIDHQAGRLRY